VKTKIQENIQTQKTITASIKEEDHCLLRWRVHNTCRPLCTRRPLRPPKQHKTTANYQPPPAMAWEIWRDPHTPNHRKNEQQDHRLETAGPIDDSEHSWEARLMMDPVENYRSSPQRNKLLKHG
jgi:hypothetical protein